MAEQVEKVGFQAEVNQVLHLVTHALYSNKEIFLRELISNASDAADKLRYKALTDSNLFENDSELKIWIDFDKSEHTITIRDNGIGMSRDEVKDNLGTIAKSGTREFLKSLSSEKAKNTNLIGQFGVGFYSSFVVAEKVIVKTRKAGMKVDEGVYWESTGEGDYLIKNTDKNTRGTEVILYLKKNEDEFLDSWRLRNIINKYSDHIILPILMKKAELLDSGENKTDSTEYEMVNRAQALWTLPKQNIKEDEYKEFFKNMFHDFEDPLCWSHNKVEGKSEYTLLLYIPSRAPFDLWNRDQQRGVKLYVRRVFIMDDAEQLLPQYLRFVRGIVDSNDLPLNISREILQQNKTIEVIRSALIKRVLTMLENMVNDEEKYQKFWQEFGQVLKEGPAEDQANREQIAKLLRFASTYQNDATQNVSLDHYISRMKPDQDKIYYLTADTINAAKSSPHLEVFRKNNIEVLLMPDRIDEWLVANLNEYKGKKLQSISQGNIDLGKLESEKDVEKIKELKEEYIDIIGRMTVILKDYVSEIRLSERLIDSPSCLVSEENSMGIHLQRLLQASGQNVPVTKPILEINGEHPLITRLKTETDEQKFADWAKILYEQALLAEGGQLIDPAAFVKRVNLLLITG